jgi:Ca-activated chloride channel family protein
MIANGVAVAPTLEAPRELGMGRLCVTRQGAPVSLPLARVRIVARVADRVAQVTLEQTFHNPFTEALEAVYLFPLSGGAAVGRFELQVGKRTIQGVVQERGEARRAYQRAIEDGKRSALLEQERDDVFTVQVGNLPPGEEVAVRIVYSERLPFFENGTTQIRLPLVVAPRYIPGQPLPRDPVGDGTGWDTDQVPDASRLTPPRLVQGFDPKVALSVEVEVADGVLADLACSQHAVRMSGGTVALARQDELQDRDFVLRWRLAGEGVKTTLLTTPEGYGMLSILPPQRDGFLGLARDVVFILDRSGSMSGPKMSSAARACSLLLATLGPRDRFAIVAFDDTTEWFGGKRFATADEAGLQAGEKFLRGIDSRGGTELDPAMSEALDLVDRRAEQAGRVPVVVLLTDGQVGNEAAVFKRLQTWGGDTRIFTVGIDTAVNEAFLKRLASLGGGTCTCVIPGEALEDALRQIGREIGAPLVVDVTVEGAEELAPARVPDLFAGRAATVFFRGSKGVTVRGRYADGKEFKQAVKPREVELGAIGHLWARMRVTDLEDRFRLGGDPAAIRKEIVELAVRHALLTRFTAFVVVDEKEIVNPGGQVQKVVQPVHLPEQWDEEAFGAADLGREMLGASPPASRGGGGVISFAKPSPSPSVPSRPAEAKMQVFLGGGAPRKRRGDAPPAVPPDAVSKSEEQAFRKALEALRKSMAEAGSALVLGTVPPASALEKARKALQRELSTSALGTRLAALQRLLRSGLLELVALLQSKGTTAAVVLPILQKCDRELEESLREGTPKEERFWETAI